MPVRSEIDEDGLVTTRAWGTLTAAEVLSHQDRLFSDRAFDPNASQIVDLSEVEVFDADPEDIRSIAANDHWGADARRVFVGTTDLVFGMARMHGGHLRNSGQQLMVVRTVEEAHRWLEEAHPVDHYGGL